MSLSFHFESPQRNDLKKKKLNTLSCTYLCTVKNFARYRSETMRVEVPLELVISPSLIELIEGRALFLLKTSTRT